MSRLQSCVYSDFFQTTWHGFYHFCCVYSGLVLSHSSLEVFSSLLETEHSQENHFFSIPFDFSHLTFLCKCFFVSAVNFVALHFGLFLICPRIHLMSYTKNFHDTLPHYTSKAVFLFIHLNSILNSIIASLDFIYFPQQFCFVKWLITNWHFPSVLWAPIPNTWRTNCHSSDLTEY